MSHRLAGRTGWKRLKPTDADFDCRHSHPMAETRSAHCRLRRGVRGIRETGREAPFDNPWHEFYEDRDARSSILARSMAAKPDTLKQTDDLAHSIQPLAKGAGQSVLKVLC